MPESDDRWFLNPQYKIEIKPNTKLIISLMQEDEKLSNLSYQNCNFIIMLCSGKYSRVWDVKDENIIKRAINTDGQPNQSREILTQLDYYEVIKKLAIKRKKKVITKFESVHINLIPYIEFTNKYEIEKAGAHTKIFKPLSKDGIYYLRIFSSEAINILELPRPFEITMDHKWIEGTCGGRRFISDSSDNKSGKLIENQYWPMNPQFLLRFDKGTNLKVIIKKTTGTFSAESKIGLIITKPDTNIYNICPLKNLKATGNYKKSDSILRILESTNKILDSKKLNIDEINKKLLFNSSEWVVESSYSSIYSASLFQKFNKIDSPILIIPTLDNHGDTYEFKFSVFSNKPVEVISLNNETTKLFISEWTAANSGGSHLSKESTKPNNKDLLMGGFKKVITWIDNPKFHLSFDAKERISELEFQVVIARSEFIWSKKISSSIVNSMIGMYIFQYDSNDRWKNLWLNERNIEFLPKNEIVFKFKFNKVDPRGYILMPSTYGPNVLGPFSIMIICKETFELKEFSDRKN